MLDVGRLAGCREGSVHRDPFSVHEESPDEQVSSALDSGRLRLLSSFPGRLSLAIQQSLHRGASQCWLGHPRVDHDAAHRNRCDGFSRESTGSFLYCFRPCAYRAQRLNDLVLRFRGLLRCTVARGAHLPVSPASSNGRIGRFIVTPTPNYRMQRSARSEIVPFTLGAVARAR